MNVSFSQNRYINSTHTHTQKCIAGLFFVSLELIESLDHCHVLIVALRDR